MWMDFVTNFCSSPSEPLLPVLRQNFFLLQNFSVPVDFTLLLHISFFEQSGAYCLLNMYLQGHANLFWVKFKKILKNWINDSSNFFLSLASHLFYYYFYREFSLPLQFANTKKSCWQKPFDSNSTCIITIEKSTFVLYVCNGKLKNRLW